MAILSLRFAFKHLKNRRHSNNAITIETTTTAIQMIALVVKSFLASMDSGVMEEEGPRACFQSGPSGEGAHIGEGEGAAWGDEITVVLNGFPSFLQSQSHHS